MKRVMVAVAMSVVGSSLLFGRVGPGMGRGAGFGDPQAGVGMRGLGLVTNLTQDQRDKIFAIQQNLRKDIASLGAEADQIRYDLRKVMTSSTLDEKKATDLHAKLQTVQQKIAQRRFEAELEMIKVLTPEQRQQLQNTPVCLGRGNKMGRKW
ncbi:MAG: Spy/CpxP family protein refolding chaperone [Brevinematales bacterium]